MRQWKLGLLACLILDPVMYSNTQPKGGFIPSHHDSKISSWTPQYKGGTRQARRLKRPHHRQTSQRRPPLHISLTHWLFYSRLLHPVIFLSHVNQMWAIKQSVRMRFLAIIRLRVPDHFIDCIGDDNCWKVLVGIIHHTRIQRVHSIYDNKQC